MYIFIIIFLHNKSMPHWINKIKTLFVNYQTRNTPLFFAEYLYGNCINKKNKCIYFVHKENALNMTKITFFT